MLLNQKSQTEVDRDAVDASVLRAAEAVHHLAITLDQEYRKFWLTDTARMLDRLNNNVPRTLAVLAGNAALGEAVNTQLDILNLPQFSARAPIAMPDGYQFVESEFVFIDPAVEDPSHD
jgi:hypothetical protein